MPGPVGQGNLYSGALSEVNRQVQAMRNLAARSTSGPPATRVGAIGSLMSKLGPLGRFVQPALSAATVGLDIGTRLQQGQNPVNAIVAPLGGLAAGAVGARFGGRAGAIAGYPIGSYATDKALNFLSENAVLSDRGAIQNRPRIGGIPPRDSKGESYRDAELRLSAAARAAGGPSAGGGIGGGNAGSYVPNPSAQFTPVGGSPSDRAYQEAAISTAQQTASNPLFQRYRIAELSQAYNTAKTPEEKQSIGMKIWAQTNPQLAAKLQTGSTGYVDAMSAPGISNNQGAFLSGLTMPSSTATATADLQKPMTMQQTFGTPIPGVGMVSQTPMSSNFNPTAAWGQQSVNTPVLAGFTQSPSQLSLMPSMFDKPAPESQTNLATLREIYNQRLRPGLAKP